MREILITKINIFLKEKFSMKKSSRFWYNDDGFSKLLFEFQSASFTKGFFINVGVFYNDFHLKETPKGVPKSYDWHLFLRIDSLCKELPYVIEYDLCNEDMLNKIFHCIETKVIPFVKPYREAHYLKNNLNFLNDGWDSAMPDDKFREFLSEL